MSRKRKSYALTRRQIKALSNPATGVAIIAILAGTLLFIAGSCLIISLTTWMSNIGISNELVVVLTISTFLALLFLIVGILTYIIVSYYQSIANKYRGIQIANVDLMNGVEFEKYLQRLLIFQGYSVNLTQASGDLGVDLVASRNDGKIAIQAKRQSTKVSRRAISDAVAGMQHYGCNKAMVITNNYFSPGAVILAQSTGCILVDRGALAKWINEYRSFAELPKQPSQPLHP